MSSPKMTIPLLAAKKKKGEKIVMVTAYDFTFATLIDRAADILLVGDSLGMVVQGAPNTLGVTVEEVIYHTRAVSRAAASAHVVADMPFLSYQVSDNAAVLNAGRLLKEGGAESVKLEGGSRIAPLVKRLSETGIPVMGHVGLEPQQVHRTGGYKMQGRDAESRDRIFADAQSLEAAGAYALVLEGIPQELAKKITAALGIPTIGIASGPHCDGQVLVSCDLLGLNPNFSPRFVKRYLDGAVVVEKALQQFAEEVRSGKFPDENHTVK